MEQPRETDKYRDIIQLPYQKSKKRPWMSLEDRAAQFAPFAALTGHKEAIEETARITQKERILDETEIERINEKLMELSKHPGENNLVRITYFQPEPKKEGGAYLTDYGVVKKIDSVEGIIKMENGVVIPMAAICSIE